MATVCYYDVGVQNVVVFFTSRSAALIRYRMVIATIIINNYRAVFFSPAILLNQESLADKPFNGIVQRIILNEKTCNLSSGLSHEVVPYRGAPCGYAPCLNGGTCFPVLSRFLCHCGPQHFGPLCEHSECISTIPSANNG